MFHFQFIFKSFPLNRGAENPGILFPVQHASVAEKDANIRAFNNTRKCVTLQGDYVQTENAMLV